MAQHVRMVFDANANLVMVIVPSFDWELLDPNFSPPNMTAVNVPMATYTAATSPLAMLQAAYPLVAAANPSIGLLLGAQISAQSSSL